MTDDTVVTDGTPTVRPPAHAVYGFPVQRPGFVEACEWSGDDSQLILRCTYRDEFDRTRQAQFTTRNAADGTSGDICLPVAVVGGAFENLGVRHADILLAHTSMVNCIARTVPGSVEFLAAMATYADLLTTALGTTEVTQTVAFSDQLLAITYAGEFGAAIELPMDYASLGQYVFSPDRQVLTLPGRVRAQLPAHQHDYPDVVLTDAQRAEVVACVLGAHLWV